MTVLEVTAGIMELRIYGITELRIGQSRLKASRCYAGQQDN